MCASNVCVCVHACVCTRACARMHRTLLWACLRVCACMCVHACMCTHAPHIIVCMPACVCMHVCACMHVHACTAHYCGHACVCVTSQPSPPLNPTAPYKPPLKPCPPFYPPYLDFDALPLDAGTLILGRPPAPLNPSSLPPKPPTSISMHSPLMQAPSFWAVGTFHNVVLSVGMAV